MRKIIGYFMCAITFIGLVLLMGFVNSDYKGAFFAVAAIVGICGWVFLIYYLFTGRWKFWEE